MAALIPDERKVVLAKLIAFLANQDATGLPLDQCYRLQADGAL